MPGDVSRYGVTSSDPRDEEEADVVNTARVPARIVQTSKHSPIDISFHVAYN